MPCEILLKKWDEANSLVYPIRLNVFVEEQNIPIELEIDEFDKKALHLVLIIEDMAIGTARIFSANNLSENAFIIGRLAVLKPYRGHGYGKLMMEYLIEFARHQHAEKLYLHAQKYALTFYEKLGFIADGEEFDEGGILHITCYKILKNTN